MSLLTLLIQIASTVDTSWSNVVAPTSSWSNVATATDSWSIVISSTGDWSLVNITKIYDSTFTYDSTVLNYNGSTVWPLVATSTTTWTEV